MNPRHLLARGFSRTRRLDDARKSLDRGLDLTNIALHDGETQTA